MIRECNTHGYFSDDELCPACNSEGRFIMSSRERDSTARKLALVLRHAPEKFDLEMDINGWIDVRDITRKFKESNRRQHWMRPHHIRAISETDPKGRYEVKGNMMRATYGHTVEIELDLPTLEIPDSLYFPCNPEESDNLLEVGLNPGDRLHVHLSSSIKSAATAGRFHMKNPAIIEIDSARMVASGETIWHAGVTVYLSESVPPDFLSIVGEDNPELQLLRESWAEEE